LPDPHSEAGIDELPGLERAAEALTQDFDRVRADLDEALTTLSDLAQSAGIELNWTREPLVPQLKSAEERAQMVRASAESQLDEFERASASASDLRLRFDAATSRLRDAAARENTLSQESAPDQLASALTQLLPMITGNTCPACGQDFALGDSLRAHIEERVEELSAVSVTIADAIAARISAAKERDDLLSRLSLVRLPTEEEWSELQFRLAQLDRFSSILRESLPPAADLDDIGKRRDAMRLAAAEANSRASLLHSGLSELSRLEQLVGLAPDGSLQERLSALDNAVSLRIARATAIEQSQAERELAEQRFAHIIEQEANLRVRLSTHEKVARRLKAATSDAERRVRAARSLRQEALSLRSQVISDVFDGRLNGLWADLFSRLAPDESFVPSFHITHSGARAVGVDLVSTHVSGAAAGRPGTVLSYGNANTAALTLFMSLHFAALDTPRVLLLDDPVQSMDEVHVSNFAALLRRVAYDNQRQVVVAVHERALFEYLQLELAPGEGDGELIAVEIAKDSPANPVRVQASTDNVTVAVAGSG
jgi:exonuclease SbcC